MPAHHGLEFRPAVDGDWREIFASTARAFGITAPLDEHQQANERARIADEDTMIARDPALPGAPLVGMAMYYRLQMSVPGGGSVAFPGLTWVSVSPTHRRRGILRELLTRLRSKWDTEGHPVAALWASEGTIYARFGFGPAVFAESARIPGPQSLRVPAPAQSPVRFVDAAELAAIAPPLYERWARVHPGVMARDALWWQAELDDRPSSRLPTLSERHAIVHTDGYATYRLDSADSASELPVARIEEVVAVTEEAHTELWRVLAALDLVASTTATLSVGDPLPFKLTDLRGVSLTGRRDTLWIAILDVPAALTARTYADDLDAALIVDDPTGGAGGRFALRIVDGVAQVTRDESATAADGEVTCDIAGLGSLYMGGVDARDLAAAGRVRASSPESLRAFARVWQTEHHPATGTDF
jgi:predicted acetyltransferase